MGEEGRKEKIGCCREPPHKGRGKRFCQGEGEARLLRWKDPAETKFLNDPNSDKNLFNAFKIAKFINIINTAIFLCFI